MIPYLVLLREKLLLLNIGITRFGAKSLDLPLHRSPRDATGLDKPGRKREEPQDGGYQRVEAHRKRRPRWHALRQQGEDCVETIRSGKELCDEFFERLLEDSTVDSSITGLLHKLYTAGELSRDGILKGLEALRQNAEEDREG